jgi:hypothetical protein
VKTAEVLARDRLLGSFSVSKLFQRDCIFSLFLIVESRTNVCYVLRSIMFLNGFTMPAINLFTTLNVLRSIMFLNGFMCLISNYSSWSLPKTMQRGLFFRFNLMLVCTAGAFWLFQSNRMCCFAYEFAMSKTKDNIF